MTFWVLMKALYKMVCDYSFSLSEKLLVGSFFQLNKYPL